MASNSVGRPIVLLEPVLRREGHEDHWNEDRSGSKDQNVGALSSIGPDSREHYPRNMTVPCGKRELT